MNNISMSRISPKLIDVENNRVETVDIPSAGIRTCNIFGDVKQSGGNGSPEYVANSNGRFPTQLFTNIKNDRYKYVKNIT